MFAISWRNPPADDCAWRLDDYIEALLAATTVIASVTRSRTLSVMSACAGSFTTMALLGYLAERGDSRVHSQTLLVTALMGDILHHRDIINSFIIPVCDVGNAGILNIDAAIGATIGEFTAPG